MSSVRRRRPIDPRTWRRYPCSASCCDRSECAKAGSPQRGDHAPFFLAAGGASTATTASGVSLASLARVNAASTAGRIACGTSDIASAAAHTTESTSTASGIGRGGGGGGGGGGSGGSEEHT